MMRKIFDPSKSAWIFILLLSIMYICIPLYAYYCDNNDAYNFDIVSMCFVSCIMIMIGFLAPLLDNFSMSDAGKLNFNPKSLSRAIVVAFSIFFIFTISTAESIPLISYLKGAGANQLSAERGALFKGREGIGVIFLYFFSLFTQALMPYAVAEQFIRGDRWRLFSLTLFFVFTIISLQKLLFVNAIVPFAYAMAARGGAGRGSLLIISATFLIILYSLTRASMGSEVIETIGSGYGSFISSDYRPSGAFDALIWRTFAVPVFTASDTLHVFYERLGGSNLYGATSNLISALTGANRVNLERMVFEYEWGWNDVANANSVYFVDAFVNFGWIGICLISFIIGQSLRWFKNACDEGLKSLWVLYCIGLFNATSIAMLFSNGYLLILAMLIFARPKSFIAAQSNSIGYWGVNAPGKRASWH